MHYPHNLSVFPNSIDHARRVKVVVDLGHLMTECLIRWGSPNAVAAIAVRLQELLRVAADPIGLSPHSIELHVARPLPEHVLLTMTQEGHRAKVDVEPEIGRHRAAARVIQQLQFLRLPVPVTVSLGESRYRGIGRHPKRSTRLDYNLRTDGFRSEPIVTQAEVDMRMAVSMIQACLTPVQRDRRQLDEAIVLLSVDRDMAPVLRLLQQSKRDCHVVHYAAAKLPRCLRDVASSVTTIEGLRLPPEALAERNRRKHELDELKA